MSMIMATNVCTALCFVLLTACSNTTVDEVTHPSSLPSKETWVDPQGFSFKYPRTWFAADVGMGPIVLPPSSGCTGTSSVESYIHECQEESPFMVSIGTKELSPGSPAGFREAIRAIKLEYRGQAGLGEKTETTTRVDGRYGFYATFHQEFRPPAGADGVPSCRSCLHERSYIVRWRPDVSLSIYVYAHSMRAWHRYIGTAESMIESVVLS